MVNGPGGTQEMWLQFPVLPHISCKASASHAACHIPPRPKGRIRAASMISNSQGAKRPGTGDTNTPPFIHSPVQAGWQSEQSHCGSSLSSARKLLPRIPNCSDLVSVPLHCLGPSRREAKDKLRWREHGREDRAGLVKLHRQKVKDFILKKPANN